MSETQEVEIRPVVARISDLAPGKRGLKRQRPSKAITVFGIRCRRQAVVYHLGDKSRNAQEFLLEAGPGQETLG